MGSIKVKRFHENNSLIQSFVCAAEIKDEDSKLNQSEEDYDSDLEINYELLNADCEINNVEETLSIDSSSAPVSHYNSCIKHSKPIEAYCTEDCSILCISCILEDGYQAIEFEQDKLQEAMRKAQIIEFQLNESKNSLLTYKSNTEAQCKAEILKINRFYNDIISKIENRRKQVTDEINKTYYSEEQRINQKLNDIQNQMECIEKLKIVTYEECRQNVESKIKEKVDSGADINMNSLIDPKQNDSLISQCLCEKPKFRSKYRLKIVCPKDEIEAIVEIIDPTHNKNISISEELLTDRKIKRNKASVKNANYLHKRELARTNTMHQYHNNNLSEKINEDQNLLSKINKKTSKNKQHEEFITFIENNESSVTHKIQKIIPPELKFNKTKPVDYDSQQTEEITPISTPKECKVIEICEDDSDDSMCESIKSNNFDAFETTSICSVADSTVVVSATSVTPEISMKFSNSEQKPKNIHSPTDPFTKRFQKACLRDINSKICKRNNSRPECNSSSKSTQE